jgi:hypothetical protein
MAHGQCVHHSDVHHGTYLCTEKMTWRRWKRPRRRVEATRRLDGADKTERSSAFAGVLDKDKAMPSGKATGENLAVQVVPWICWLV